MLRPEPGEPAINSGLFAGLWGTYLVAMGGILMMAADARNGGFSGFSIWIVTLLFILGSLHSHLTKGMHTLLWAFLNGVIFGGVMLLGIYHPILFGFESGGPKRPFCIAIIIYTAIVMIVSVPLKRAVSPDIGCDYQEYNTHFDNSWRIFQTMLSIMVAIVVGVVFPMATVMVERQNILLEPLAWLC